MGALYRKKRPATFDAVVGQEHVKEVLKNAIRQDRLAHAYLFSGPRGVGKTTLARILAMASGCQAPGEERPCGVCEHCRLVQAGQHPDVLEIDAASNNSVEDVRELKERILLAPVRAPKKVIILDEAHMMSKSAFNALLKTLEEPPEHVLFVFATTEPERMPATIKSRTQHFRFRRLSEEEIRDALARLAEEEGLEIEEDALALLAQAAEGAMRDALVLLERVLTLDERPITRAAVERILGLPPAEATQGLLQALLSGAVEDALKRAQALYLEGYAPRTLVGELKQALKERLVKEPKDALVAALLALDEADQRLAKDESRLGLELALLRAHQALFAQPPAPKAAQKAPEEPKPKPQKAPPKPAEPAASQPQPKPETPAPAEPEPAPSEGPGPLDPGRWQAFLEALPTPLRAVVREARPELSGKTLVLRFAPHLRFHIERARAERARLSPLAQKTLGAGEIEVRVEDGEAVAGEEDEESSSPPPPPPTPPPEARTPPAAKGSLLEDPRFKRLKEIFAAELIAWEEKPLSEK